MMKIADMKDMPRYNAEVKNGADSVSSGKIFIDIDGKPACLVHGAINKVSKEGIWRCLMCNEGCYEKEEC